MSNPILNEKFVQNERVLEGYPMTVKGTLNITAFLTLIVVISAAFVWSRYALGYTDIANMLTWGGLIVGFVLGLIIAFTKNKYIVPLYAACEGLMLGGISSIFESQFPGIVVQAVAGTFAAVFSTLLLYKLNIIRCTDKFRSVIFISTVSIALVYLIDFIGHFFGYSVPLINEASTLGIGISLIVVAIASLNLIIDFDFIERGEKMLLPKDYEWYGAFGLLVTIVWVYIEILKLLAKLNRK
ncbi:MAG: Bax inhibitor-1/YccA family protein [bacterium]|nr:Bax inhibitor-1/YccA family protein [bacterium]